MCVSLMLLKKINVYYIVYRDTYTVKQMGDDVLTGDVMGGWTEKCGGKPLNQLNYGLW